MLTDLYYDPWDFDIDIDPYPTYRRLRDESPVYYNERYNFWGVSRYADVDAALKDTTRLSSAKGDILEVVMTDPVMPPRHLHQRRSAAAHHSPCHRLQGIHAEEDAGDRGQDSRLLHRMPGSPGRR
jgi:cytochrome P450